MRISIIIMMFIFCSFGPPAGLSRSQIKVTVTVFPLMEFVKETGGEWVDVHLLLPPGAEIHSWQPRPSDVIKTASSHLFVYIGSQLEPWAGSLLKSVGRDDLAVMEAGHGVDMIRQHDPHDDHRHEQTAADPHIWLDFSIDKQIVDRVVQELTRLAPDHAAEFESNGNRYKKKLDRLDQKFRRGLKECRSRLMVLGGHSAFGYLARRYDLEQISVYGLSPDEKPTPGQLVKLIKKAEEMDIRSVFFEEYISNEMAVMIAREIGAETYVLNPGANLSREEMNRGVSFIDLMERNLESIKNGLGCRQEKDIGFR